MFLGATCYPLITSLLLFCWVQLEISALSIGAKPGITSAQSISTPADNSPGTTLPRNDEIESLLQEGEMEGQIFGTSMHAKDESDYLRILPELSNLETQTDHRDPTSILGNFDVNQHLQGRQKAQTEGRMDGDSAQASYMAIPPVYRGLQKIKELQRAQTEGKEENAAENVLQEALEMPAVSGFEPDDLRAMIDLEEPLKLLGLGFETPPGILDFAQEGRRMREAKGNNDTYYTNTSNVNRIGAYRGRSAIAKRIFRGSGNFAPTGMVFCFCGFDCVKSCSYLRACGRMSSSIFGSESLGSLRRTSR